MKPDTAEKLLVWILRTAGDVHRFSRVITFQAVAILTVVTYGSILMHYLPVIGN